MWLPLILLAYYIFKWRIHKLKSERLIFLIKWCRIGRCHAFSLHFVLVHKSGWKCKFVIETILKMLKQSPHFPILNGLNLPPHPQGFWFPPVCLHITSFWFTPSPLWMCAFSVFVLPSGPGVNACILECIYPSISFSGLENEKVEADRVPWRHDFIMSIVLPEICLTGAGQACIAHSPACSGNGKMLQYLYNGLMMPEGLSVFWNATKNGLFADFQTSHAAFVLGIHSNERWLFCVMAPKQTEVSLRYASISFP